MPINGRIPPPCKFSQNSRHSTRLKRVYPWYFKRNRKRKPQLRVWSTQFITKQEFGSSHFKIYWYKYTLTKSSERVAYNCGFRVPWFLWSDRRVRNDKSPKICHDKLVVVIYPNVTLQVGQRKQNIFSQRWGLYSDKWPQLLTDFHFPKITNC